MEIISSKITGKGQITILKKVRERMVELGRVVEPLPR